MSSVKLVDGFTHAAKSFYVQGMKYRFTWAPNHLGDFGIIIAIPGIILKNPGNGRFRKSEIDTRCKKLFFAHNLIQQIVTIILVLQNFTFTSSFVLKIIKEIK